MSEAAHNDWVKCPPGEFGRLAGRLRGRRHRRNLLRATTTLSVVLVLTGAWLLWPGQEGVGENSFAGIPCSRVMELANAYAAGELTDELRERIREHVSQCPDCSERFKAMGLSAQILLRGHPDPLAAASGYHTLALGDVPATTAGSALRPKPTGSI